MSILSRLIQGIRTLGPSVTLQAALYPYRKAAQEARFAQRHPLQTAAHPDAGWSYAGRVLAHRLAGAQTVELTCENALVRIDVLAADLMRVRVSPSGRFPDLFSWAVCRPDEAWPLTPVSVQETAETLSIFTPKLRCEVDKTSLRIAFLDLDGAIIQADESGPAWQTSKVMDRKRLADDEHVYGLGQKATSLDKRGLALEMWNTDPQFYHPGRDPLYSNVPFYVGLRNGRGYGMFWDMPARSRFDFGCAEPGITCFDAYCEDWHADETHRYYFFYGPSLVDVLDRYTELTGRMIMPPLWALGYHQNRWSYYPESRVREIAREFRQRRIPCEAIHLDIDYMDGYRCFTWHPKRFPRPAQLIADLHADGFKAVVMIDPGIKKDRNYWVYQDGLKNDVFCRYPDRRLFSGPVWAGESVFPDFTSERVRRWWGELYRGMVDLGVDGFWNDMNEPAVLGQQGDTFPDAVRHDSEGRGADHATVHNVYGMQMARASAEGLMRLRPDERPLVISRSVWAGSQRYNMHWLGDNFSEWESLHNTMSLVLNMGLSGLPFTGPDTGGFAGDAHAELLIRWNQLSTFLPFFRNHSAKNTAPQEPWVFGPECERISRQFIELRYRLLPYIYTTFWQCAQTGLPMARPLCLVFQNDRHAYDIQDEFMFGDAFLVAPVCEPGATWRRVYIPAGRWYDFWSGALLGGPQITRLDAPLDRVPLLVRAGSVVPMWPLMQHTGQQPLDTLILHVYPGCGESLLYEDDGHTWNFRQGQYRLTRLICELDGSEQLPGEIRLRRQVDVEPSDPAGLPVYERVQVCVHGSSANCAVMLDGQPIEPVQADALSLS